MSDLVKYLPSIYSGILETASLTAAEDILFGELETQYNKGQANQYILTADVDGIKVFEDMVGIVADPSSESLEFRRQRLLNRYSTAPPFTMRFLERKLDEIIGIGAWTAYLDYDNYTLYIETSANNQLWYHELRVTINRIKPANIVFINKPTISNSILASEVINTGSINWNYKLGTIWLLGQKPFASFEDKGVIKVASASSIEDVLLNGLATETASQIASVRINGTYIINAFTTKTAVDNAVTVEYNVPASSGLGSITSIEFLNANLEVLTDASVYVPLNEDAVMKHTISMKEG